MTPEEVAQRFGVSVYTVLGWRKRGLLAGKISHVQGKRPRVRFTREEVAAFQPPPVGRPPNETPPAKK